MQQASFLAYTDLEIGDVVLEKNNSHSPEWIIHDIRTIHYLRAGTIEFEFRLMDRETKQIAEEWDKRNDLYGPLNTPGPSR